MNKKRHGYESERRCWGYAARHALRYPSAETEPDQAGESKERSDDVVGGRQPSAWQWCAPSIEASGLWLGSAARSAPDLIALQAYAACGRQAKLVVPWWISKCEIRGLVGDNVVLVRRNVE